MPTTKERIIDASAALFMRQGYVGTGMKQIVAEAGAPFGSLYHFFPGGKDQLTAEVIGIAGKHYELLVTSVIDAAPDVVTGTRDAFRGAAEVLRQTDFADACPIATIALEVASTSEPLRQATADVFESWLTAGAERFVAAGISRSRAREVMIQLVALLEGGFILSRATKDASHTEIAGDAAVAIVRAALPKRRPRRAD